MMAHRRQMRMSSCCSRSSLFLLCLVAIDVSGSEFETSFPVLSFDEGYAQLFGDDNLIVQNDGRTVQLSLDERTGSGFISQDLYLHGYFSASIKLPSDYTAGVVVAFYMSNGDMFEKNHDEIDFEFLGNIRGKDWRIQTNVYGNGSVSVGREERYRLWFDPSDDFHQYSILWTDSHIMFYVDNIPIREVKRNGLRGGGGRGGMFPSKPMSLYATIWDGSDWATNGGKYKLDYKYAPYVSKFTDLVLHGCPVDPLELRRPKCEKTDKSADGLPAMDDLAPPSRRAKMAKFRTKFMTYSYCYDRLRYRIPPPECVINPREARRLKLFDPVTFGTLPGRRSKHPRSISSHRLSA